MSPKQKQQIFIGISLLLAGLFLWLAIRGIDVQASIKIMKEANYYWVLVSVLLGILAYVFRALRWQLFYDSLGYAPTFKSCFWSISFGYIMNLTIPRSGEVARATALYRTEGIPVNKSLGTIVLDRFIDMFLFLFFLVLTLVFRFDVVKSFSSYFHLNTDFLFSFEFILLGISVFVICIGLIYFLWKYKHLQWVQKIIDFLKGMKEGFLSIRKVKQKYALILYSFLIWICYYLMTFVVVFSFDATSHLNFMDGFFLIIAGSLGMLIPASGGIGSYHAAMKYAMGALFLTASGTNASFHEGAELGFAYGLLLHTSQTIFVVVLLGIISFFYIAANKKQA